VTRLDTAPLAPTTGPDPRRWVTLAIAVMSAFIVVLDTTVLNVAIPTILRDFNTTVSDLQWVITGYSLTFATLLIIGGRLGDVYGHRRILIIGAAFFGVGSLIASVSQNVPQLVVGEAIIEGIGASLMLPATLAVLSNTFEGRERASAFAAWGATAGVAAALGPLIGGFFTTYYTWRWSFRINVIVAPLTILGALFFMPKGLPADRRPRIDIVGACMIAVGMFLLVFGLSEGNLYGFWKPTSTFTIAGHELWPVDRPISISALAIIVALAILTVFVFYERAKERRNDDPLFEFTHFRHRTYRYGLITSGVVAMGQLGISFVLPLLLQDARHLTPVQNGLWQLPTGIALIIGAQVGARLIRAIGTTVVVRLGLLSYVIGLVLIRHAATLDITALKLLPGLVFYGIGIGFAGAQLSNVVLSEIPKRSSGVASGANTTMRQVGGALGIAVIASVFVAQTLSHAVTRIKSAAIPAGLKVQALAGVHAAGASYVPAHASAHNTAVLQNALHLSVAQGVQIALDFATVVVVIGLLLSFLIPPVPADLEAARAADPLEPVEPIDVDPRLREVSA
jgi:EmrB/QacA subfamily drug resistance transporter